MLRSKAPRIIWRSGRVTDEPQRPQQPQQAGHHRVAAQPWQQANSHDGEIENVPAALEVAQRAGPEGRHAQQNLYSKNSQHQVVEPLKRGAVALHEGWVGLEAHQQGGQQDDGGYEAVEGGRLHQAGQGVGRSTHRRKYRAALQPW